MPVYKYQCSECNESKEVEGDFDHDVPECSSCGEEMDRDYEAEGPPGIQFKGEGFHVNDYS